MFVLRPAYMGEFGQIFICPKLKWRYFQYIANEMEARPGPNIHKLCITLIQYPIEILSTASLDAFHHLNNIDN